MDEEVLPLSLVDMRKWLLVFGVLMAAACCRADDIKMRGAEWDDLATALEVTPFFLEIQSSTKARSVKLLMEIHQEGKLVRTISSTGFNVLKGQEAKPINLKSSLFFVPKNNLRDYAITWAVNYDGNTGTARDTVLKSVVDFPSLSFRAVKPTIADSPISLVALIICKSDHFSPCDTMETAIAVHKDATVIGIYLVRE